MFRQEVKISSLFTDELFTAKVLLPDDFFFVDKIYVYRPINRSNGIT